jgi:flagellar basal body-associated protein FliL
MVHSILLDIAPEPAGTRALLSIVLLVIGFVLLLAAALVVVLWFRKRSMRGVEMIRPDALPAPHSQANNPNQP